MRKQVPDLSRKTELWLRAMELGASTGCHQRADRSFFVNGYQMPLCARCTGVGLGQVAALIWCVVSAVRKRPAKGAWGLLLMLPAAVDGATQALGWRSSNNRLRFATGLLAGFGWLTFFLSLFARPKGGR